MDELVKQALELLKNPTYHDYALKGLAAIGLTAILPKLMAKATPWVLRAADRVADVVLRVPVLRDLILLFADDIIATLQAVSNGLEKLIDTFSNRLEERIRAAKAAEEARPAPPTAPPATIPNPPAGDPPEPAP